MATRRLLLAVCCSSMRVATASFLPPSDGLRKLGLLPVFPGRLSSFSAGIPGVHKAYRRPLPKKFVTKIINFLSKTFKPSECMAVDVACGSGETTLPLAPFLKHIVGIEASQALLDQINGAVIPDNVHFQIGESDYLPFADSSLHLVNVKSALHWLDIPTFFREVDRVLKPSGVLAVSVDGGIYDVLGYEHEANKIMHEMLKIQPLHHSIEHRLQLARDGYKDIDFPYDDIVRDWYEEQDMESVADVVRFWTRWGGFDLMLEDEPEKAKKIIKRTQKRLMKLLSLKGDPEEARVKIRYNYLLVMCRKPL